jgi:hypothetical protein
MKFQKDLTLTTPNEPFSSPEINTLRGPYWDMPIGEGLEVDYNGSVQTDGSTPSDPLDTLYGSQGLVGIGSGLYVDNNGNLTID